MTTPRKHTITAMLIAALCMLPLPTLGSTEPDMSAEDYWGTEYSLDLQADGLWIDGITHKVLFAAASESTIKAYLAQIDQVRAAYRTGDEGATRTAMNKLMMMLENRDYGMSAKTATLLFDYCNVVAPARYHDVSRHHRQNRDSDTTPASEGFGNGDGGYSG
jgi:hypothetical protein